MFSKMVLEILGAGAVLHAKKDPIISLFLQDFPPLFFQNNLLLLVVILFKDALQLGRHVVYSLKLANERCRREEREK